MLSLISPASPPLSIPCVPLTHMPPPLPFAISTQASNKITYKITLKAQEYCATAIEDFNVCAKGRSLSMIWACRAKYRASQDCVHQL